MRAKLAILCLVAGTLLPGIARAELLQEIRSRGTLKVGMAEYFPWMTKWADGKPEGLEVEIAERLAADLGVQLEVVTIPFDSLVDRLAARQVDMVASNLSITPERALKVAFTQPYSAEGGVHPALRCVGDPLGPASRPFPRRRKSRCAQCRRRDHRRDGRHRQRRRRG